MLTWHSSRGNLFAAVLTEDCFCFAWNTKFPSITAVDPFACAMQRRSVFYRRCYLVEKCLLDSCCQFPRCQ